MKLTLGTKILIGMASGAVVGAIVGPQAEYLKPFGDLFIRLMQIVVLPLVLATITSAMFQAGDMRSFGRIGGKTLLYFLGCTVMAVTLGLIVAQIIQPGQGFTIQVDTSAFKAPTPVGPKEMLLGLISPNVFQSLSNGRVLEVIVFSLLLGGAIQSSGSKGDVVKRFFESFSDVMVSFVHMVVGVAPYGVFCLMAPTTGKYGLSVLLPLASVIGTLFLAALLYILIVYVPILMLNKYPVVKFFKVRSQAIFMAFSSALSAAALPFSLQAQKEMGVSKKVRNFVIPLGMTVNMNGTAIYLAISATFIANVYGIALTPANMLTIVVSGVLAAVGATSVPMSGLIMLTLVLSSTGLPLEGLALVAGIERILDMIRTTLNVMGDNVTAVAVAASEKEIFENAVEDSVDV